MLNKNEILAALMNLREIEGIVEASSPHMSKEKRERLLHILHVISQTIYEYNGTLYHHYKLGKMAEKDGKEYVDEGDEI